MTLKVLIKSVRRKRARRAKRVSSSDKESYEYYLTLVAECEGRA